MFHTSLKNLSSENDNISGLKFGKTLLCLKSICQQTNRISVEEMFFTNGKKSDKLTSISDIIRDELENGTDSQVMVKTETNLINSDPSDSKNIQMLSLNLPSYLNAYYSTMQRKANFDLVNNQQKNLIANSLFNNMRSPFLFQLPNYSSQTFV